MYLVFMYHIFIIFLGHTYIFLLVNINHVTRFSLSFLPNPTSLFIYVKCIIRQHYPNTIQEVDEANDNVGDESVLLLDVWFLSLVPWLVALFP